MLLGSLQKAMLFLLSCALLMACATEWDAGPDENVALGEEPAAFDASEYTLAAGDRVRVTVFGENDLSGDFAVDGEGRISMPLVGDIGVGGLTTQELQGVVEAAYLDGFLRDPRVSAEVVAYRPFFILGEVTRPGTYPYQNGLTVLNAVATAEGFTYRANERFVFIRREGAEEETRYPLTSTTPVRPGDTIRIAERYF